MKKRGAFRKKLEQLKKAKTIAGSLRRNRKRLVKIVRLLKKLRISNSSA